MFIEEGKCQTKNSLSVCGDGWHSVWEEEIITKNSIIPSQSTLVTKSIFKFSYLEIQLADPLCAAYLGTLKKEPYFHLPPMRKCHPA